ncbi:HAD family hydrolase [Ferroglobus sp.]|uniref:HAD family hydrolase n=1 Tax=Ferroglobus sp. TaxID=2614230 RepID=UPI0025C131FD|nr:HAD family hydrolase [Ferroglobus sp.]
MVDRKIFIFDFDGTLVDSYSCLPEIYKSIAVKVGLKGESVTEFVKRALEYENLWDYLENYDRKSWWTMLFAEFNLKLDNKALEDLLRFYWVMRAEKSFVVENCAETLEVLKNKGKRLVIVAGNDGLKSIKRMRIKKSGLSKYFDEIFIVGEDAKNRVEAIKIVANKYNVNFGEIVFVDDKPSAINEVKNAVKDITAVRVKFKSAFKPASSEGYLCDFEIEKINDLLKVLEI